ncbi:lipoyl synthase [Acidobacteriota bacterium]
MTVTSVHTSKKPSWLKVKLPTHDNFFYVSHLLEDKNLNTICQSAKCPNVAECWSHKTATFLILGDTCTRSCSFCSVKKGSPASLIDNEPEKTAEAIVAMGLQYAVITSVTRDDLPDGGANHFARTLETVRKRAPEVKVEVLIPDFQGNEADLKTVMAAKPDIINHNIEVPENIYSLINRPVTNYQRSLWILSKSKEMGATTKSGLMVGMGEQRKDILRTLSDLRSASCDLLTIGQYLQPTKQNAPIKRYYTPEEFDDLRQLALAYGFNQVESGPLVRSSYRAHKMFENLNTKAE